MEWYAVMIRTSKSRPMRAHVYGHSGLTLPQNSQDLQYLIKGTQLS